MTVDHGSVGAVDEQVSPEVEERVSALYHSGDTWAHRVDPLTKLAAVPALTLAGLIGGGATAPYVILGAMSAILLVSGLRGVLLTALRVLTPVGVALVIVHGFVRPDDGPTLFEWGILSASVDGLHFAARIWGRLAVFVFGVTFAMRTVHPKVFSASLIQRGVSHKLAYAYLAGAELIPRMRSVAGQILDAQQSRGFDTKGSPWRRVRTLFALLKPLVLSALIAVEVRTLALEARGFAKPGRRTSTAQVPGRSSEAALRPLLLVLAIPVILAAVIL